MTHQELRAEIESGPLAAALAPFWAQTFPADPEPGDGSPDRPRWERIRHRFGALTPDAVHGIRSVLGDRSLSSRPYPMAVAAFATFLASRGLLRRIKAAVNDAGLPSAVRDVCDLVVTTVQSAPDRVVDPSDTGVTAMMGAMVAGGIVSAEDVAAFVSACTLPCSRLEYLGWHVTDDDIIKAKSLGG